jgi:hypothetical protein
MHQAIRKPAKDRAEVRGEFLTIGEDRFYMIRNADAMNPFFISVISNADHWLFVASTGGLTAGRVSPETALFPYRPVDQISESAATTGPLTIVRLTDHGETVAWTPFSPVRDPRFEVSRNLFKNTLGNKLCFEEVNDTLGLAFRYTWKTSDEFGFVRNCQLENRGEASRRVEILDGLQNILPAGTPRHTQTVASNLVNAYKWSELDKTTGLGLFTLYAGISDRAEPCESLRANVIYALGVDNPVTLLSSRQVERFRAGGSIEQEAHVRGIRGAYLVAHQAEIDAGDTRHWTLVADVQKSQDQVVELRYRLGNPAALQEALQHSIDEGSNALAQIMGGADGFQSVAEEIVSCHHFANVVFNVMRGGIIDDQYTISAEDFKRTMRHFNSAVAERNADFLANLPATILRDDLLHAVMTHGDAQLERLCREYLPVTFGRRHGDPSRPWNHFTIKLRDESGNRLLSYEGNWRDIFQNWEALALSYPEFVEGIIAKFVNASTADGYNPYRITKQGIDWEVEEKDDPWSYIGYWGDHQIIYLLKLLEMSHDFHPRRLGKLLRRPVFSYANVPYRIHPFAYILENPKATVEFDHALADQIERRVSASGADAKLVSDADGEVYLVNLLEKLLVALLAKLGNMVIGGGIWLNTQRPEWNDANNALVGNGLSMVTLYYMRRYVAFLRTLLQEETEAVEISAEISDWLNATAESLRSLQLDAGDVDPAERYRSLTELGEAASRYRTSVYEHGFNRGKSEVPVSSIIGLLDDALEAIDFSISANRREDGLFHAYNLLRREDQRIDIDRLYPMLEGQVAALSSGALTPQTVVDVVETLFASEIYRHDQKTFMLYPDRDLPKFLAKNTIPSDSVVAIPFLKDRLDAGDDRIVSCDADGKFRFNPEFSNVGELDAKLDDLAAEFGDDLEDARGPLRRLYEEVFQHHTFTGRSGTMFGFEGLGCIYWHMVSKLLLAVQENFFAALDAGADEKVIRQLCDLYYRIRSGLGFNKSPDEYGAFPADPYSHTPSHSGARQPGMTGQVKEEILTRFGELGIRVRQGKVRFQPGLLRRREFPATRRSFEYLDVDDNWQEIDVAAGSIAFTWCQVPLVYVLDEEDGARLLVEYDDGTVSESEELFLTPEDSEALFTRCGRIRRVTIFVGPTLLAGED